MTNKEEFVPNEQLRQARSLKGWSQAELAEQVGTSFEIVSRWERGITIPSPYYRERLCAVLGTSAEELGFAHSREDLINQLPSPLVFLASSHKDADKPIVSHLKSTLQDQGVAFWSSRQLSRQGNGHACIALREVIQAAQVILVILSPEAVSSRHVREALDIASRYERPMCGVWIEGEHWELCLPRGHTDLAALIDAREQDTPAMLEETAKALEHLRLASQNGTDVAQPSLPDTPIGTVPPVNQSADFVVSQSRIVEKISSSLSHPLEPTQAVKSMPSNRMEFSRASIGLLIGLTILVIAGGTLGSLSLLTHFKQTSAYSGATTVEVVRGGIWNEDFAVDPYSLIPDTSYYPWAIMAQQALYLPLFYGDARGVIHPGAATEIPTVQNGDVSADATTWKFHLRPHLLWSDGQPYDARDVAYTWKLMLNPTFYYTGSVPGLDTTSSVAVSADHLSITFHLKQPYAPFLDLWIDGYNAPLPAQISAR